MKLSKLEFRKKCLSEKYYASIKYMSHTLKGKERTIFIKKVCDINIYLGCLCALTCEQDNSIDNYINYKINNYFKPVKVYYYDPKLKKTSYTEKKLRSFDIANYLLACNLMGNKKAINWYFYSHEVNKNIIIQLSREMTNEQLIELLLVLSRSNQNKDKMRGIGSTKNLYANKHDVRIKEILRTMWYEDKDAFVQLAYDTCWLGEIWKYSNKRELLYIKILNKCSKLMLAINLINDSLGDGKRLHSILSNSYDGRKYIYLYYLNLLQKGEKLSLNEYREVEDLPEPNEKIKNYFISFFISLVNEEYKNNINYAVIYDSFSAVYQKVGKRNVKIGSTNDEILASIIKNTDSGQWKGVVRFYNFTNLSVKASFDDFFRNMNCYYKIQVKQLVDEFKRYPRWIVNKQGKYMFETLKTEKELLMLDDNVKEERVLVVIQDYDYINRKVIVKPYNGSILGLEIS